MGAQRLVRRQRRQQKLRIGSTPAGLPKMSNTLLLLAEPLLAEVPRQVEHWQLIIDLTALVWNGVVGAVPRDEIADEVREVFGTQRSPEGMIDLLVKRKLELFPHDKRLVAATEVFRSGDSLEVTAASVR